MEENVVAAEIGEHLELASKQSGISHDAVARMQGISPEQWYQQRRGFGHVSLRRLSSMVRYPEGRLFLAAFWPLLAEAWGMTEAAAQLEAGQALASIINKLQVRMLRADFWTARVARVEERRA